jgi:hypothetical protein
VTDSAEQTVLELGVHDRAGDHVGARHLGGRERGPTAGGYSGGGPKRLCLCPGFVALVAHAPR